MLVSILTNPFGIWKEFIQGWGVEGRKGGGVRYGSNQTLLSSEAPEKRVDRSRRCKEQQIIFHDFLLEGVMMKRQVWNCVPSEP